MTEGDDTPPVLGGHALYRAYQAANENHDVESLAEELYIRRMSRIPRLTLEHQATVEARKCLQVAREFWAVVAESRALRTDEQGSSLREERTS